MQLPNANVCLRYLLNDHPILSLRAKAIIQDHVICTDPTIIVEVVWVLGSFYKLKKSKFIPPLLAIVDQKNNKSPNKNLIIKAMIFLLHTSCLTLTAAYFAWHRMSEFP